MQILNDNDGMALALELAAKGMFTTTPNPRVGCVIVRGGEVIGSGYTQPAGHAHAEIMSMRDAQERGHDVRGATAYVTLEPCNHHGRTPPCSDALVRAGLGRVVAAITDPNPLVAVAQTPYSSFRGAPTRLERLSGATTDLQHIIHQGMSHYNATFWVGANAVIRKRALEDIVEKEWVGGFEIKRYVQDRTVIEDTESSIDLALHGWRLINYPERLSYSATPPDFGSLVIQRRRWANGGLLILPKLWTLLRERKNNGRPVSKVEFMIFS